MSASFCGVMTVFTERRELCSLQSVSSARVTLAGTVAHFVISSVFWYLFHLTDLSAIIHNL